MQKLKSIKLEMKKSDITTDNTEIQVILGNLYEQTYPSMLKTLRR